MGKTIKKDDKNPPEDSFDPLLVESHQAETVVLMLKSSEEEVQIKACEAIYRFACKCDENKQLLLQLNTIEQLLRLLRSEEKLIRRNSVMVLSTMCHHNEVRKAIKDDDSVIPLLLGLLSTNEYVTTVEFTALALGCLCQDYQAVSRLLEHNGIVSLVECLASEDPDVQKNAIGCLDLVLRDFEARPLLGSCNGVGAMLELLQSEYPVIQEGVINALAKAALDSNIRGIIRDLDCLNKFVDIIGRPELNDLHNISLQVIATCLLDQDCVKQLKENGGLMRLLAFIGDAKPPEDESKDKPKKTSKQGSARKKKKEDEEKPKESVSSFTLPEVKVNACKAIARACRLDIVRQMLHECDTERLLVALLSHESESVRVAAAQAIAMMSLNISCQGSVYNYGGIEALVKLLKIEHKDAKEAATLALANLTTGNVKNSQEIASKNGLEYLVNCLSFSQEGICCNSLVTISNMATEESLRSKLLQNGLIKSLVEPLQSLSSSVQSKAALAVALFLTDSTSKADFRNNGGLEPLVNLLSSNNSDVRRSVCWAITIVSSEKESAEQLAHIGAIPILQEMNQSNTKRNKFSEAALNRLYDSNLNLKYALVGYLDFTDQIGDVFYDCGQHKVGSNIDPLEKIGMDPLNTRRATILVNCSVPKPATPALSIIPDNDEKKNQEDKSTTKKKGSKNKKEIKRTSSLNTNVTEDSLNSCLKNEVERSSPVVYKLPVDSRLMNYIDDVLELIAPLESVLLQASELAKYVSQCMGGPISPQDIMSFPYELALSQLKVEFQSNVIPIGSITSGIHVHRALLFKFLADKLCIPVNLHRGDYNRSWNEIWVNTNEGKSVKPNTKLFIIDLVNEPGRLIPTDSPDGHAYRKL